jgi:hypothetical protein
MRARTSFYLVAAASLVACATKDADVAGSAADLTATGHGEWGGQVTLRDRVTRDPELPMPDGGWYVTPIHTTLLPSGKIFVSGWSRAAKDSCTFPDGSRRNGASFVLDPAAFTVPADAPPTTLAIAPLDENFAPDPPWKQVLYCAGHAPVVVGDETAIVLTGGSRYLDLGVPGREVEEGLRTSHLAFPDRPSPVIERVDDLLKSGPICKQNDGQELAPGETQARGGKWYATNTRLPDGTVLVTGGFTGGPTSQCDPQSRHSASAEIFDPATRTSHALFQPEELPDGFGERFAPGDKDYTHTVLLPEPLVHDGHAFPIAMMGFSGFVVFLSLDPTLSGKDRFFIPPNGSRPGDVMAWDSTMALVSTGELLVMGGTGDTATATRIDLYDPKTDHWTSIDTKIGRRNAAATLLPDGKVLLVNGWRDDSASLGLDERTRPIVFDPETRAFQTFDGFPGDRERGYHSFSLLGKDGSIYVGGGIYPSLATASTPKETDIGCERTDVQTWRPPYLTSGAPRPALDPADAPLEMQSGGAPVSVAFRGATLDPKKGAVLMALGSFTHGFDQNQRYVRLSFQVDGGAAVVAPPATANAAPPGDYLLFLVSDAGAPSVGRHVRVSLKR